jgi:hypothetical protein
MAEVYYSRHQYKPHVVVIKPVDATGAGHTTFDGEG